MPRAPVRLIVFPRAYAIALVGLEPPRYVRCMTTDPMESLKTESDRELELAVRAATRPADTGVLARLLSAFDDRHRRRETFALRESTRALKQP